jgi:trehalose-6-phosphatase
MQITKSSQLNFSKLNFLSPLETTQQKNIFEVQSRSLSKAHKIIADGSLFFL